jgi:uncharacterized membrane protein YeaQ/YmgE (transglycosylase-associated protein family)
MKHARLALALAAGVIACLLPAAGIAQDPAPYITLYEPIEWAGEGGIVSIQAGALVRVRGLAYHAGGVKSIRVGGADATLEADPSGAVRFSGYVRVSSAMTAIEIVLAPNTGDEFRSSYALKVEGTDPEPATVREPMKPGAALIGGLVVPGVGQMMTRRPALGLLFMGGAVGAVVASRALSKAGVLECNEFDECDEVEARKNLVPAGIGAAVVLGIIGAIEARSYAAKYNAGLSAGGDASEHRIRIDPGLETSRTRGAVAVRLLRLTF